MIDFVNIDIHIYLHTLRHFNNTDIVNQYDTVINGNNKILHAPSVLSAIYWESLLEAMEK